MANNITENTPPRKRGSEADFTTSPSKRHRMAPEAGAAAAPKDTQGHDEKATSNEQESTTEDWQTLAQDNLAKSEQPKPTTGVAPIKAEFRVLDNSQWKVNFTSTGKAHRDDDEAEGSTFFQSGSKGAKSFTKKNDGRDPDRKRERGQNKNRQFGSWGDRITLCNSRALRSEFSPDECRFGDQCRHEHDLRKYLAEGKSSDLSTFDGKCPVWAARGICNAGWKCRWVTSHMTARDTEDGRKELILTEDETRKAVTADVDGADDKPRLAHLNNDVFNVIPAEAKMRLSRRKTNTPKADEYSKWLSEQWNEELRQKNQPKGGNVGANSKSNSGSRTVTENVTNHTDTDSKMDAGKSECGTAGAKPEEADVALTKTRDETLTDNAAALSQSTVESGVPQTEENVPDKQEADKKIANTESGVKEGQVKDDEKEDHRAGYKEPPFLPSEKRRLYYGPDTPVLAPLTTQGNLPFRRLCVELGAQVTWSEMAMGLPLIQGEKPEWALMKCHSSEVTPPKVKNSDSVSGYENSKDLKFGVQVAANKPWIALKTAEILSSHLPYVRAIDLNCGCPIDLVFQTGAGSALLDNPAKLEKMLRGMNALSGEIPITAKIRTGTRDKEPNADKVVNRLLLGSYQSQKAGFGPPGVAAITLHGRTRQQRYSRAADWEYIADISALVNRIQKDQDQATDTTAEPDGRNLPNGGKTYFLGNGDCYSHIDYWNHIDMAKVDSVMIGRGALIKPWLFEEIESQQYLDKSASERLSYVEKFARYGLECWGSDEAGVGTTRRFLLEWLSFSCRYVPIGLLETLPPKLNDRPPRFRGRNELESLLASKDYRDWIKISEMFLGPAHKDFRFTPKHKSNSYDNADFDAEG